MGTCPKSETKFDSFSISYTLKYKKNDIYKYSSIINIYIYMNILRTYQRVEPESFHDTII